MFHLLTISSQDFAARKIEHHHRLPERREMAMAFDESWNRQLAVEAPDDLRLITNVAADFRVKPHGDDSPAPRRQSLSRRLLRIDGDNLAAQQNEIRLVRGAR